MTIPAMILATIGAVSLTVTLIAVCIKIDDLIRHHHRTASLTGSLREHSLGMLGTPVRVYGRRNETTVAITPPAAVPERHSLGA